MRRKPDAPGRSSVLARRRGLAASSIQRCTHLAHWRQRPAQQTHTYTQPIHHQHNHRLDSCFPPCGVWRMPLTTGHVSASRLGWPAGGGPPPQQRLARALQSERRAPAASARMPATGRRRQRPPLDGRWCKVAALAPGCRDSVGVRKTCSAES
jgi:hypothetical protein